MFQKKEFVYSCGHVEMVPDDGNWSDSSTSPCDKCLSDWRLSTANDVAELSEEEIQYCIDLKDKVSDYGFNQQFH